MILVLVCFVFLASDQLSCKSDQAALQLPDHFYSIVGLRLPIESKINDVQKHAKTHVH